MKKKSVSRWKQTAAAGAAALVASGTLLWMNFGTGNRAAVPAYEAARVIDGDTFVTRENQYIRVASTEAPELDQCGGNEAKAALEKLVLGKPVYLKVMYRDPFQRLVSVVYADGVFVNKVMLAAGYAYYYRGTEGLSEELQQAGNVARGKKLGLFGESCTQMTNTNDPSCTIKGNTRNGNIYYLPDCGVYPNVTVQLYQGDRWFCSEAEAKKAGFRKPAQCP